MALDRLNDLYANDASDTVVLRHYLRQYTYIDYTAEDWLGKLLYALPLHGMNQQEYLNADDEKTILLQQVGYLERLLNMLDLKAKLILTVLLLFLLACFYSYFLHVF